MLPRIVGDKKGTTLASWNPVVRGRQLPKQARPFTTPIHPHSPAGRARTFRLSGLIVGHSDSPPRRSNSFWTRLEGDMNRRPAEHIQAEGSNINERDRLNPLGVAERLAVKRQ